METTEEPGPPTVSSAQATENFLFGDEEEKEEENESLDHLKVKAPLSSDPTVMMMDDSIDNKKSDTVNPVEDQQDDNDDDALFDVIVPSESATDRFRNALARTEKDSAKDVAAWSALINEAQILARDNTAVHLKLLESCYGALLKVFPTSAKHWTSVAEFLLSIIDPENFSVPIKLKQRANRKLDRVFRDALGVNAFDDQNMTKEEKSIASVTNGPCSSSIELWNLYIHKCVIDAREVAGQTVGAAADPEGAIIVRDAQFAAYDKALEIAGFVSNCHELWSSYISNVNMYIRVGSETNNPQEDQKLKIRLRSIFQRAIGTPSQNLEELWREYEVFEQRQSEALAQALLAEHLPRLQHAKQVFLERKQYMIDLKTTRLSVPPENNEIEKGLLHRWKKRCAYERTNPERLNTSGLAQRVRQVYKDCICVLARHPEVWHEWASWEAGGYCGGGIATANEVRLEVVLSLLFCREYPLNYILFYLSILM